MSLPGDVNHSPSAEMEQSNWRHLADVTSDIMYLTDANGVLIEANPALCRLFRRTREGVVGARISDHLLPDHIGVTARTIREIVDRRTVERSTRTYQFAGQEPRTFEVIEAPVIRGGKVWAIAGVGREITQEIVLEHKLWDTVEERQGAVEFALRTSLGLVKGYVAALGQTESLPAPHRTRYLHIIQEEMDHLSKMIEDLMDMRRLERMETDFRPDVVHLSECLDLVTRQFEAEASRRDITLEVELPSGIAPLYLPREALIRVLINLVQNGIHHTLHTGTVRISVQDHEAYIEIAVRDNGAGIPETELPHVFDKYYRGADQSGSPAAGIGLGLPIARTLVEAMGGKILVTSRIGTGTEFKVVIPRRIFGSGELEETALPPETGSSLVALSEGGRR